MFYDVSNLANYPLQLLDWPHGKEVRAMRRGCCHDAIWRAVLFDSLPGRRTSRAPAWGPGAHDQRGSLDSAR